MTAAPFIKIYSGYIRRPGQGINEATKFQSKSLEEIVQQMTASLINDARPVRLLVTEWVGELQSPNHYTGKSLSNLIRGDDDAQPLDVQRAADLLEGLIDPDSQIPREVLEKGEHLQEATLTGGHDGVREYTGEYAWNGKVWGVRWEFPASVCASAESGDQDESCLPWKDPQYVEVAAEEVTEDNAGDLLTEIAVLTVRDEGGWPSLLAHGGASETLAAATNAAQERYGEAVRACLPVYGQQTVYELREVLKGMMRDYLARLSAPITEVTYDAKIKVCGNSLALPVDLRTASRLGIERGDTVVVTIRRKQQ